MLKADFRREFDRVCRDPSALMMCEPPVGVGGTVDIVVGLNGDHAVMHGGRQVALSMLRLHPVNDGRLQEIAIKPGPALTHSISTGTRK